MHPAPPFAWTDEAAMLALIREVGFARIFAQTPNGPRVAHCPVLVRPDAALHFHLARGNALVPHFAGATALALVEGPNAYVSANWYADQAGAVPTWNYVAVECEGVIAPLDEAGLVDLLDDLAAAREPAVEEDWTRAKMAPGRFEAMLDAIRGFAMPISALRGTAKLSQNKSATERARLVAGFNRSGAVAMAGLVETVGGR